MPREQLITVTCGGISKDYLVVYEDDLPERREAVQFFQKHAKCLHPSMEIPPDVADMPIENANAHFRRHPIQEQWSLVTIGAQNPIQDSDLARLRHLPEIQHVQIYSDKITDEGVKHLLFLRGLSHLVLYSGQVTDDCLIVIQQIRSLVSLDLQAASKVSRESVLATVNAMPWLQDVWPPPDPIRLAECQRRSRLSQEAQADRAGNSGHTAGSGPQTPLRYVDLSRSPLARPPAGLFDTDDIERLDLIECGLEVLPDAVGNLTRLRTLYASWGRLTDLPITIGRLTSLEALWLNNNRLKGLPGSLGNLIRLKKLALDANHLAAFPTVILELKRLEELRMNGNRISSLPDNMGDLTELRSLSLGHNNLATLPRSICCLEKLTYLGLQGNPLRTLPDEVWQLPCLITLNLAHTGITVLPPGAARIPNILGLPGQKVHT